MSDSAESLNDYAQVSFTELVAVTGYSIAELHELIALGALEPAAERGAGEWWFSAGCIERMRRARHLQRDFELSLAGVALLLAYRERIEELEHRVHALECLLPSRHA
jgi:chaperone modulatory protein CbpM